VIEAGNPEAYVRRIIVNEHISWWRRFGRREVVAADPPAASRPTRPTAPTGASISPRP
jgi:DNA-directed RNA polymerase specialized sigma24 family protein